jgi:Lon protease-like protein
MSVDTSLPDDFDGRVRLFPLPNLVLFPYVVQPLHIFEPRYRQMTADALEGDRLIAMATLAPGWESGYQGNPPIYPTICIGRIIKAEPLPDGRYNLLLLGLSRAHIVHEESSDKLYRTAQTQLLEEVPISSSSAESELRQKLDDYLSAWFASKSAALTQLRKMLEADMPLGTLCDIFSFTIDMEVERKLQLLAEVDIARRIGLLLDYLGPQLPANSDSDAPLPFPPRFSDN